MKQKYYPSSALVTQDSFIFSLQQIILAKTPSLDGFRQDYYLVFDGV
jgi:hypothetical protein